MKPLPQLLRFSLNKLPPRARLALRWCGYVAGYLVVLTLFFYITFPFAQLKQRIIAAYATTQSGASPGRLEIDDLTWSFAFPGVVASGVRMVSLNPPVGAATADTKPRVISLDEMSARVSPIKWLFGTKDVSFSADGLGGEIEGSIVISSKGREYSIELRDVSPGQLPTIAETIGLPMKGTVNGEVKISLPEEKAALAQGNVNLVIDNLEIGDGKAKIRDTIALPTVQVGTLEIQASVTNGQLKIEKLAANGSDLELEGEGKIRLRDKIQQSGVEVLVRFGFTDKYRNKSELTKAIFGDPKSTAPGLFDLDPTMKRAKQPDGSYNFNVSGSFDRLRYTPTNQRIGSQRTSPGARPAAEPKKASTASKPAKPEKRSVAKVTALHKKDGGH
jgi:type II secretion system protein N